MLSNREPAAHAGNEMQAADGEMVVTEPSLAATGETPEIADRAVHRIANDTQHLPQDVHLELTALAERVGGFERLAELIDVLRTAKR
jgi:hypothetical protein